MTLEEKHLVIKSVANDVCRVPTEVFSKLTTYLLEDTTCDNCIHFIANSECMYGNVCKHWYRNIDMFEIKDKE